MMIRDAEGKLNLLHISHRSLALGKDGTSNQRDCIISRRVHKGGNLSGLFISMVMASPGPIPAASGTGITWSYSRSNDPVSLTAWKVWQQAKALGYSDTPPPPKKEHSADFKSSFACQVLIETVAVTCWKAYISFTHAYTRPHCLHIRMWHHG